MGFFTVTRIPVNSYTIILLKQFCFVSADPSLLHFGFDERSFCCLEFWTFLSITSSCNKFRSKNIMYTNWELKFRRSDTEVLSFLAKQILPHNRINTEDQATPRNQKKMMMEKMCYVENVICSVLKLQTVGPP